MEASWYIGRNLRVLPNKKAILWDGPPWILNTVLRELEAGEYTPKVDSWIDAPNGDTYFVFFSPIKDDDHAWSVYLKKDDNVRATTEGFDPTAAGTGSSWFWVPSIPGLPLLPPPISPGGGEDGWLSKAGDIAKWSAIIVGGIFAIKLFDSFRR